MATKKEQRQEQSYEQSAASYKELMLQIKDLEKQAAPHKKALTDYAKSIGVLSLEIGGVTLEKRVTPKGTIGPGPGYSGLVVSYAARWFRRNVKPGDRLQGCAGRSSG